MKDNYIHPGAVNSSFTAVFAANAVLLSYLFSRAFPEAGRTRAFLVSLAVCFTLFLFMYILRQLSNGITILRLIFLYAALSVVITIASTVRGPILDGTLPIIRIHFLGSKVYSGTGQSIIDASVFVFYGMLALICATLIALAFEYIYNRSKLLELSGLLKYLLRIDASLDKHASAAADDMYLYEKRGVFAALVLLGIYLAFYFAVLII